MSVARGWPPGAPAGGGGVDPRAVPADLFGETIVLIHSAQSALSCVV